jgi:hypothetical protein
MKTRPTMKRVVSLTMVLFGTGLLIGGGYQMYSLPPPPPTEGQILFWLGALAIAIGLIAGGVYLLARNA